MGSAIYYPIPVHRQKPFVALGYGDQRYPVTERLTDQVLSIPVHPSLTDDEVATVIGAVNETAAELGPLGGRGGRMTMSPDGPLRAGVVGLGMMGRNHVRVWDEVDRRASSWSPWPTRTRRAARGPPPAGALAGSTTRSGCWRRRSSTSSASWLPRACTSPVTLAALRAGANVLVEKPIAATRDEAQAMIAAADAAGRMLTVGHIERFNPAIRELRRRLEAGELGRIFQVKRHAARPVPGAHPRRRRRRRPRAARPRHHALPRRLRAGPDLRRDRAPHPHRARGPVQRHDQVRERRASACSTSTG